LRLDGPVQGLQPFHEARPQGARGVSRACGQGARRVRGARAMRFHSLLYVAFLAVAALIAFALPRRARKVWLLVTSYLFYASWHPKYVVLLFAVSTVASLGGRFVAGVEAAPARRLRGALVIALLASILGAFKYLDWVLANVNFWVERSGG